MQTIRVIALLLLLCLAAPAALASEADFDTVPDVLRPGKAYSIVVDAPHDGTASLQLQDAFGATVARILAGYPVRAGENTLLWNGMTVEEEAIAQGDYSLVFAMDDGPRATAALRIGAPYPLITRVLQNEWTLTDAALSITFEASEAGTLELRAQGGGLAQWLVTSVPVAAGQHSCQWDGTANGERVPAGEYTLSLTLRASNGTESMEHYVFVEVAAAQSAPTDSMVDVTPAPTQAAAPAPTPAPASLSAPYSSTDDGTYWAMTPGETDDAVIWEILTQPITVYDDGRSAGAKEHAYMMSNPDGTGERVAQLHVKSQGLHVVGEENEHGYILVEAFSNYDRDYSPETDEARAHAFDLKQGYVQARYLKTVEVEQNQALLIDKLSQRMYLFVDGVRVTEFLIATGRITSEDDYLYETTPGEFITISRTGGFPSGNMYCDMAIRINGGILLHEVPFKTNADGTRNYSAFEGYLGTKQSHGCVRIQRLKNAEGYNHAWLWKNIKLNTKVIIWDDLNRVDRPVTWQPNPTN